MRISEILAKIPHRYPFILVDKVISIEEGVKLVAHECCVVKNETIRTGGFSPTE